MSRLFGHAVHDVPFGFHLQVGANLFVELPLGATAMDETANDEA